MTELSKDGELPRSGQGSGDGVADALITYFQPFYNLEDGRLQGLEALARRRGEGGGSESPADFFDQVAAEGRMSEIDLAVLEASLDHIHDQRAQNPHLILSVNLSWEIVGRPGVDAAILAALERHGMPGYSLLVDISTETFRRLLADDSGALERIRRLQENEVAFCLDGFTSADLDMLHNAAQAPVDIIKLHPNQIAGDGDARQHLTALAKAVQDAGLPTVAAGVETESQLALVTELGFEWAQGYFLGEPMPAEASLSQLNTRINVP